MPQSDQESWWKPRTILKKFLGIQDSTHSIALGTAIGMAVGMTPTVGAQSVTIIILVFLTKRFFHFNRMAALLTIYISNPLTMVPIYYFLYWVGTFFVPGTVTQEDLANILKSGENGSWWEALKQLSFGLGTPLLIGTAIVSPLSGLLTYPIMHSLLVRFRKNKETSREQAAAEAPVDANETQAEASGSAASAEPPAADQASADTVAAATTDQ